MPMPYVDGYVLPVPKKKLAAYRRIASIAAKVWREHGALEYRECAADDLNVKCGTPFPPRFMATEQVQKEQGTPREPRRGLVRLEDLRHA